jgi:DNA-directed RNA polymerase beta subunit
MNQSKSSMMSESFVNSKSAVFVDGPSIKIKVPSKKGGKRVEAMINETTGLIQDIIRKESLDKNGFDKNGFDKKEGTEESVLSHLSEYLEEPYKIIESYFGGQHLERLVRHQIESYNHFINFQIQRTIQMFNTVTIHSENDFVPEYGQYFLEVRLSFENFKLYPPQIHENNGATKTMLPQEAKLRNFTYASTMTVDLHIEYIVRNTEAMDSPKIIKKTLPKINIGKMPIMIKSSICVLSQNSHVNAAYTGECPMDCGGYFIIKGSEKTVLGQERAAENRIYCFDGRNTTKWNWFAEIKSVPDFKCISPKQIEMMIASKNNGFGNGIYITIPRIKQPIELFVLFRALGIITDKDICRHILLDIDDPNYQSLLDSLQASIIDANKYLSQEDAIRHITSLVAYTPLNMDKETGIRKKREFTLDVLNNDLFPHCKTVEQKIYLIGYMCKKLLLTSMRLLPPDDRDSYLNKRIELTGTLVNNLFRNYFNKLVKEMQKQIVREINTGSWRSTEDYENIINMTNIYKIMKSTTIENGITRALSTGDFSIKQANTSKVGVAQVLNRLTYLASLSHLRRINTPLEKSGELIAPRKLHNTTFGFLCLTGDTDILLSNKITTKKMEHMVDCDWVNTVNPDTLRDEESYIHSCFRKMPDTLFEITTISGRKIKATGNHPFLVNNDGDYQWKNTEDLLNTDRVIIRHTIKDLSSSLLSNSRDATPVYIPLDDILDIYRMRLVQLNLVETNISNHHLSIFARLIGLLYNSGNMKKHGSSLFFIATFYLSEEVDAFQVIHDIESLGFDNVVLKQTPRSTTKPHGGWEVSNSTAFAYFIQLLSGFINDGNNVPEVPSWIMNGTLSVKREFASAFQGSVGSPFSYQNNNSSWKPYLGVTSCYTTSDVLNPTMKYMIQMVDLFRELQIKCTMQILSVNETEGQVCINFNNDLDNLVTYANTINYTYCDKKRKSSAIVIEHLLICQYNNTEISSDVIYDKCIKDNICNNGCISVPIQSIKQIKPEFVYDFTTFSTNHSFVASSFVTHNCPAETPEGQSIGVVKNISYLTHITIPTNSSSLYEYIQPFIRKIEETSSEEMNGKVKVFVNGAWVGVTENPLELYQEMKEKKYKGIINIYTSIVFDYKLLEIRICNDGGRLTRPLLRVKNNKALITDDIINRLVAKEITWNDLLTSCRIDESVIEYIDPEEQNSSMIAMRAKDSFLQNPNLKMNYTHCEIHPSTIFGVLASCIPFPEHNQAPRNTYQCAMSKQAIGVYATNYHHRMDKTSYILTYPSRPLVDTRIMNFIQLNKIPSGTQIHVAIMTHTGYNQEDSVLVNKGSIDRGLFSATIYHTEKDEDKNIVRDEIIRCKPDKTKTKGIKFGNYEKLNSQGFIPENNLVENRDVIIAKIIPIKENRNDPTKTIKYEDQSKTFRTTEETYIDKNYTGRNGDGYNFAKVRVRIFRKPVLGDKFSSRHGQKGTCGNIIPECDMPFTKDGLRPDIIINPHAIPSRMTIAQLKETLLGKVLLELGLFGDGTSFGDLDIKTIAEELQKLGYESYGNEVMYNGLTGEQLETSIFIGPVFYQRLKHMVNDKQHSRSIGPMVNLTRQPAEGRSRDGGFRIGEMERDVMLAHGMSKFCRERLYDVSDKYSVNVCKKCGLIASYNDGQKKSRLYSNGDFTVHHCNTCNNTTDFALVEVPYAYKLMSQELQTINVAMRLITE